MKQPDLRCGCRVATVARRQRVSHDASAMTLPPSFLTTIEEHRCFSGTFSRGDLVEAVVDPALPPSVLLSVQCHDCLTWYAGVMRSALPAGTTLNSLASEATRHASSVRGYDAVLGGYHSAGGGFWLSAVYIDALKGFLLDGHRSRASGSDLDLLMLAFQHKLMTPADPAMTDPKHYTTQALHVEMARWRGPFTSLSAFLSSPAVQARSAPTTKQVTLALFQPGIATAAASPTPARPAARSAEGAHRGCDLPRVRRGGPLASTAHQPLPGLPLRVTEEGVSASRHGAMCASRNVNVSRQCFFALSRNTSA